MARLVYIPEIERDTWLLWTIKGEGSCLRDYRFAPAREERSLPTSQIEEHLKREGAFWETAPNVTYRDREYWREIISFKNVESGLSPLEEHARVGDRQNLQALFREQLMAADSAADDDGLRSFINDWVAGCSSIVEREQFNHWDNSDATECRDGQHGLGWTSKMLEYCRQGGNLRFITTGNERLDFALLAMEVCFGLSSRDNPFQQGQRNSIQPDGLGIRADRSLAVLEMKGPQDDHDFWTATIQAFCGALAATAKYDFLKRISGAKGGRRPSIVLPEILSSISLYVVVSPSPNEVLTVADDGRLPELVSRLRRAFPTLGDVAYFIVSDEHWRDISHLPVAFACYR